MAELTYRYVAVDRAGRRVSGHLSAGDEATAYEQLRRDGYSPVTLKPRRARGERQSAQRFGARETSEFLSDLAELLQAGADIRTALGLLGARFERPTLRRMTEELAADIAGGEPLDRAFSRAFAMSQSLVAPMVAAGEAGGDLPGGLRRASQVIESRLKLRDQLVSALAYPSFVLMSAVGSLLVILLYIVPALAPLVTELGSTPPLAFALMIAASDVLRANLSLLGIGLATGLAGLFLAARAGLLALPIEYLLLDGPVRRTVAGLAFGGFSQTLGATIAAGAPVGEALRLAIRTTSYEGARRRLEPVAHAVRQGDSLSAALGEVRSFPPAIIRLTTVGEASNTLGPMLHRSGRMEEDAALRRIETVGRIAGPALILLLAVLIGLMMGGLLTGMSQLNQAVLG